MKKVFAFTILFDLIPWVFTYCTYKLFFLISESSRKNFTAFSNVLLLLFLLGFLLGLGILLMLWLEKKICRQSEKGALICLTGALLIPIVYLAVYGLHISSLISYLFSETLVIYTFGAYFMVFFGRGLYRLIQDRRGKETDLEQ